MSALGSLVVKLALEHAQFTKGLDKSSQEALKFAKNTQTSFDKASKATSNYVSDTVKGVAAVGAAYLSVSSILNSLNESINNLATLDDMAQQTGSSVENLSRLQKLAKQFGADFGLVDTTLNKFSKSLAGIDDEGSKTAQALKALGISQEFVKNNDPSAVFIEVTKRLQNYQDGTAKSALVTDALSKSAVELLPYMNDVAENVDSVTGASAKSAAEAAAFQDQIGGLRLKFEEYYQQLTTDMLPAMNDVLGVLVDSTKASQDLGNDKAALNWADEMALAGARVFDTFNNVWQLLKAVKSSANAAFEDVATWNEIAKVGNPAQLYRNVMAGKDVTGDFAKQLLARDKAEKEADKQFEALVNFDRSATENALLKKFAERKGNASPYPSPNSGKDKLDYRGAEAEAAIQSALDAKNKAEATARDKANKEALKDIQDEIDFEMEMTEAGYAYDKKLADEKHKAALERVDQLQDIANKNFEEARNAFNKAEEEKRREFEKTVDGIDQVFREGFANMVNRGENTWKSFTTSLATTFKTTVADQIYRTFAQPFVVKLVASVLGIGTSGAAGASGISAVESLTNGSTGGLSFGSLLGDVKGLFSSGNASIIGGIESLGASISNGMGGIRDTIGGYLGANASLVANMASYGGAILQLSQGNWAGAIGTGIGTALGGPLGGAIGSFLGGAVGSMFGGGVKTKKYSTGATTNYVDGKLTDSQGLSGIAGYGRALGGQDALTALGEQYSKVMGSLFKAFDLSDQVSTSTSIFQRSGKKTRSWGYFDATFGSGGSTRFETGHQGTAENSLNAIIAMAMTTGITQGIKNSNLPGAIKDLFNEITDQTQILNMVNASIALSKSNQALFDSFSITAEQTAKVAALSGQTGDELVKVINVMLDAANASRTIGDAMFEFRNTLKEALGGTLFSSLSDFDNRLKSIDKTTQEGLETFYELFALRSDFAKFQTSMDTISGGVKGSLLGIISDTEKQAIMNADLAMMFGKLNLTVPKSIQELADLGKTVDESSELTTVAAINLAAAFPSLVAAFQQTRGEVDALMNSLRDTSSFSTLTDYLRYAGVQKNYGTSFANNYVDSLPSYDVGTSYVPNDGPAMIHKGERILTASENRDLSSMNAAMVNELRALRSEVAQLRRDNSETARSTRKTSDLLQRVTRDGEAMVTEALS